MAMRSGRGRTSSRLAKEKRSGLLDRAGNGLLLPGAGVVCDRTGGDAGVNQCTRSRVGRRVKWVLRGTRGGQKRGLGRVAERSATGAKDAWARVVQGSDFK